MQSWEKYNGELRFRDDIFVQTTDSRNSNTFTQSCFTGLEKGAKVFLILSRIKENQFVALTPPVLSKKQSHRLLIRKWACPDCPGIRVLRESFPPEMSEYKGSSIKLECRVDSGSSLTRVVWLKDGRDIAKGGQLYRDMGLEIERTNLRTGIGGLLITSATSMLTGTYKCVAENENGERAELTTVLTVTPYRFKPCPPEDNPYCLQGICALHGDVGHVIKSCICKVGFSGKRCEEKSVLAVASANNDSVKTINEMKVVMAVLGSALIATLLIASGLAIAYIQLKRNSLRCSVGIETKIYSKNGDRTSLA